MIRNLILLFVALILLGICFAMSVSAQTPEPPTPSYLQAEIDIILWMERYQNYRIRRLEELVPGYQLYSNEYRQRVEWTELLDGRCGGRDGRDSGTQ